MELLLGELRLLFRVLDLMLRVLELLFSISCDIGIGSIVILELLLRVLQLLLRMLKLLLWVLIRMLLLLLLRILLMWVGAAGLEINKVSSRQASGSCLVRWLSPATSAPCGQRFLTLQQAWRHTSSTSG